MYVDPYNIVLLVSRPVNTESGVGGFVLWWEVLVSANRKLPMVLFFLRPHIKKQQKRPQDFAKLLHLYTFATILPILVMGSKIDDNKSWPSIRGLKLAVYKMVEV